MRRIQVLGPGCAKCERLWKNAEEAVRQSGIESQVEKVTEISEIVAFGVLMTPALVIDGQVRAVGKIPSADEIAAMLGD